MGKLIKVQFRQLSTADLDTLTLSSIVRMYSQGFTMKESILHHLPEVKGDYDRYQLWEDAVGCHIMATSDK